MADNSTRARERDLILAPNEYAYILDETKGNVINYVGPHKTSLANTDQPVIFNEDAKRFEHCNLEQAIQRFAVAPEGWYLVMKNPAKDNIPARTGAANNLPDLNVGRKINIPGPVGFAPWPGQMVRVIQGHRLRSNQYLIVRVYDEEAARANWGKAVIKPQTQADGEKLPVESSVVDKDTPELTMGKLLVIKGTEVSFYIPPTGIEVVPDKHSEYIRAAITLEQLEYCTLLDENGNKRYIRGPAVVFPKPTETFVERNGSRKFKAIELNEISGLYIKVVAPYEEKGRTYRVGDELFITGKEQMIYFPRTEHAIIRYGEQEINYAVAIPAGEARYVLNRVTGQIMLKRGPAMFLPDPRTEVIVKRVLDPKQVALWFPGNVEALTYNTQLMHKMRSERQLSSDAEEELALTLLERMPVGADYDMLEAAAEESFVGDEFNRRQTFTPPRTITLDTKYEGAVAINVWTGYAVLIVSKTGERKVFSGPGTYLLEYDETLETIEFSTGTPKTDKKLERGVYLRVLYNKVSDIVEAETHDLCQVRIYLSYRINFEGDSDKWFRVENYVKFLTDHTRSVLRHVVKRYGIEHFYANAIDIIRDTLLGTVDESHKRPGKLFDENGMHIYDVEVLNVSIGGDGTIAKLLVNAQHNAVQQALELSAERKRLELTQEKETVKQKLAQIEAVTKQLLLDLQATAVQEQQKLTLLELASQTAAQQQQLSAQLQEQDFLDKINQGELSRQREKHNLELEVAQRQLIHYIEHLRAEVEAVVSKAGAISPQLVSTLQAYSERALAEKVAQNMAPLAILGGKSVAEVFAQLLRGTVLEGVLKSRVTDEE